MRSKVLLITPPFTQLNTPYPGTIFLKGFLNTLNVQSLQSDLGIELILELFSSQGLKQIFDQVNHTERELSATANRILRLKEEYLKTIDPLIAFLQNKNSTLAGLICAGNFLPSGNRIQNTEEMEWAFGTMGTHDKARHLATLYLEDLGDFIAEAVDPHFGFSRYAEHLGRYAYEFDQLEKELGKPLSFIDSFLLQILEKKIQDSNPNVLAVSVPFPGNLYGGFRCAQYVKSRFPDIKTVLGGGFANTELRSLSDARVFDYFDFICLDDGERPLSCLLEYLEGTRDLEHLKRTFIRKNGKVLYIDGAPEKDYTQAQTGIPDYCDLFLDKYLSVIEILNPMHSLWSNGRWNKLMLAHGCYWAQCSFCDTSLDYIKRFEPLKARFTVDKMERLIEQTGETGFHFVDEAAPPAILRELALEILRRGLVVSWWTNIRFEKNFTEDLCRLLAASGCIAVSGGLEVASDRLLKLINKGVTIEQVTRAADHFTRAGIMVHAYLMYGYPTQTDQETIDSLEVVRQLMESGVIQSGFWHRFALTVHSPVAKNPDFYKIRINPDSKGMFANNDLAYKELSNINHEKYSEGLRISIYNYMHGAGFDLPLQHWFPFKIPQTLVKLGFIENFLNKEFPGYQNKNQRLLWLGNAPQLHFYVSHKKGKEMEMGELQFVNRTGNFKLKMEKPLAVWIKGFLEKAMFTNPGIITLEQLEQDFIRNCIGSFQLFLHGKNMNILRDNGLLLL